MDWKVMNFYKTKKTADGIFLVRCRWRPIVVGIQLLMVPIMIVGTIIVLCLSGCGTPQPQVHPSLVLHVTGTLYEPKVSWEYSRNDGYMGVRSDEELLSEHERYERHLSLTVRSIDRQTSVDGRVRDRHTTTTRTTTTVESKR